MRIDLPHMTRTITWFIRLALVVVVLRDITPASPYVHLGPPQTVEPLHPVVCTHTRLTDEVEEWKVQRTMQLVREMGAATIVEFFPWPYVEKQEGVYDWAYACLLYTSPSPRD